MTLRLFISACILLFITNTGYTQYGSRPAIAWQKCLGGDGDDYANNMILTTDGGMLVAGTSKSNNGDVTDHHGSLDSTDAWVVKLDGNGNIQWQRSIGGSRQDAFNAVIRSNDGGYLCIGYSNSNDGDVINAHNSDDCWLVKLAVDGTIAWSKTYGGRQLDRAMSGIAMADGSYIIIGTTQSVDGDIHTTDLTTDKDGWLFKVSNTGALMWENSIDQGGTFARWDNEGLGVIETADHRIMACVSGNDKRDTFFTHYNWNYERYDTTWFRDIYSYPGILYLVDAGTGATSYYTQTRGEDRNQFALKNYGNDIYFVYPEWNAAYYECYDYVHEVPYYLPISGITVSHLNSGSGQFANSFFQVGGVYCYDSETPGVNESFWVSPFSGIDFIGDSSWIVAGEQYVTTRGGTFHDYAKIFGRSVEGYYGGTGFNAFRAIKAYPNGHEFICAGYTGSSDGDVVGLHGLPPDLPPGSEGDYKKDFWVVKISFTPNRIRGKIFMDYNNNNQPDPGEPVFKRASLKTTKGGIEKITNIAANGQYEFLTDTGRFATTLNLYNNIYYSATPDTAITNFTSNDSIVEVNFAVHQLVNVRDYSALLSTDLFARPGFEVNYHINYNNSGTDTFLNKPVTFIKDKRLSVLSASPGAVIAGDTITWVIDTLMPASSGSLSVSLRVGLIPVVNIGDTLFSSVLIDSAGDNTPLDNYAFLKQVVRGAYDPNDKMEVHGGSISTVDLKKQHPLVYTINFQNTGTDTAFSIIVRDTLDDKLTAAGFELLNASHPYRFSLLQGKYAQWEFSNILLPDSLHNEPNSHGYISYRINPKNNLFIGDTINNSASIYFDFNPPVKTNVQHTVIKEAGAVVWTGAQNTDWMNRNNWSGNEVPDEYSRVVIPEQVPNFPVLSSNARCYSLKLEAKAELMVNAGYHLDIWGK